MRAYATATAFLLLLSTVQGQVMLDVGGQVLANNSLVDSATLNDTTTLTCTSSITPCCDQGVWRLPNTSVAPEGVRNDSSYVTRGNQSISLNQPNGLVPTSGVYSCELPNANNDTETVFVGIYETGLLSNNGTLTVDSLSYDRTSQSLVCITSGGPVTMVTWLKDGANVTVSDRFKTSQRVLDTESAMYALTLSIVNKTADDSGGYQCVVQNTQGMVSRSMDVELCEESSLRLQGSAFDVVVQTCIRDVWQNVVINNAMIREEENNLDVELQATDTTITVQWTNMNMYSMYQIQCGYNTSRIGAITNSSFEQVESEVTFTDLLPSTTYSCCVRPLSNSSGFVYTYTGEECESVMTRPSPVLSGLEIGLVVVAAVLLLLLVVVFVACCCALVVCSRRQNRYESEMKEQSKHYTKQRIKKVPVTQPPTNTINLKEVGNVFFNNNAELEASEQLSTTAKAHANTQARSPSSSTAPATNKPPRSPKPKTSNKPLLSPKPAQLIPEPEGQPIYEEPGVSPSHKVQEEASNPMYGITSHDQEDEASNPMYGVTSHDQQDEASNPMYGVTSHDQEDEADNPMYGVVRS